MKKALSALALVAALIIATVTPASAADTVHLEAQAWWGLNGITIPTSVGHHIHVEALNFPRPGTVVDGTYNLSVRVTLHGQEGKTNWIRVSDGSTVIQSMSFVLGPCENCSADIVFPVKFSSFQTGIREVRLSVNVPDEQPAKTGSQRMFNSTGWPVCVRSCTSGTNERSQGLKFIETRSWYDNRPSPGLLHNYANARSSVPEIHACETVRLDLKPGSGGLPTVLSGVYVNPAFHSGNPGRVLMQKNGPYSANFTFPCDLQVGDKVALLSSDGNNAGVQVLRVVQ